MEKNANGGRGHGGSEAWKKLPKSPDFLAYVAPVKKEKIVNLSETHLPPKTQKDK